MNRREFIQTTATVGIGLGVSGLGAGSASAETTAAPIEPHHRKFWTWTGANAKATSASLKTKYQALKGHGLTGVFLGDGIVEKEFDAIKEAGLEIHSWMWTTNRGDQWIRDHHPDWYMVSRSGKSCFDKPPYVDYYRWISPVIPGVQNYINDRVAELAAHPAISGVHLDYVRYPDVILPRALWAKYNLDETEELPDYDFCYSPHTREAFKKASGRDPMEIENPDRDQEWLHFRYNSVTNLVKRLQRTAHDHGKQITAAVFPTPSQARKICRQDWDKWPLDGACPMIYHSFYNEGVEWIGDCMRENIQAATFPIYAGLYTSAFTEPEDFRKAMQLVHRRGGAGVSLFGGLSDPFWKIFEEEIWT